jgi:Ca-activated chloride channel family protein
VTVNGFQEYTQMNEASLRAIADTTGGTYYSATDADQLRAIYDSIDTQVILQPQMTEITSLLAALSLLLFLAGAITSLLWLGRLL